MQNKHFNAGAGAGFVRGFGSDMHLDAAAGAGGGGAGGGVEFAELTVPTSREQSDAFIADLVKRVNHMMKLSKGSLTSEQRGELEKRVADLDKGLARIDEIVKANVERLKGGYEGAMWRLADVASRYKVDPEMGVATGYFNLMVCDQGDLRKLSEVSRYADIVDPLKPYARLGDEMRGYLGSLVEEAQELNDRVYLYDLVRCGSPIQPTDWARRGGHIAQRMKGHPLYERWLKISGELKRALDTATATEGTEWVPTILSTRLIDLIQAEMRVSALFPHTPMTSKNVDLPVLKADMIGYFVAENTADAGTAIPTSDFQTTKAQLVAKKLATRIISSTELLEDSVVPMTQAIPRLVGKSIARALEDALLNGDIAGTHQDNDVSAATDRRKIFDGLRKKALIAGMPNVDCAVFSVANLMAIKAGMGIYGNIPSQGVWIVGFKGFINFLTMADGTSTNLLMTNEKMGGGAPLLTGQVATFAGSPVVLSEFMREDVSSTGANTVGGPNTKTTILYANRESFTVGDRRMIEVRSSAERYIEMDQVVYIGTMRVDFKEYYTTAVAANKVVGIGRNF